MGNLSDNAFNAVQSYMKENLVNASNAWINMKLITKQRFFIIHIENICCNNLISPDKKQSQLIHGYGLINVKDIVAKYNGFYFQESTEEKYSTTISIPILRDSVGSIIRQPASFGKYEPSPSPMSAPNDT